MPRQSWDVPMTRFTVFSVAPVCLANWPVQSLKVVGIFVRRWPFDARGVNPDNNCGGEALRGRPYTIGGYRRLLNNYIVVCEGRSQKQ